MLIKITQVTEKGQIILPQRLRAALRAAARKVRASMDQPFRQMNSDAIIAFLRPPDNHVRP